MAKGKYQETIHAISIAFLNAIPYDADFKDVQVKTATWTGDNKELKINKEDSCLENPDVNTFVLMHTTLKNRNKVYLIGKISKSNFLKKAYLNTKYNTLTVSEYDLDERF